MRLLNRIFQAIFFGNYFYGICAVALSIEANLQQGFPLNHGLFYLLLFCGTVVYYTHAYLSEKQQPVIHPRSLWYQRNQSWIRVSQWILTAGFAITGCILLSRLYHQLLQMPLWQWVTIFLFPLLAIWYYGDTIPWVPGSSLRTKGWLKPFVIGFIWAGLVTFYPPLLAGMEHGEVYQPGIFNLLLFIKNGMFITMLCILFDIKDYVADHNQQLKTFVVRYGLRKTLFYIIIPLTLIGLGTFLSYGCSHGFPLFRMLINTVPFILLIIVTYHMHRRKSILYYLAIIDGMMLVKALCGILGSGIVNDVIYLSFLNMLK